MEEKKKEKLAIEPVVAPPMKEAAGKDFNPLLVENFLSALKKIRAI